MSCPTPYERNERAFMKALDSFGINKNNPLGYIKDSLERIIVESDDDKEKTLAEAALEFMKKAYNV